jgi:hypothetical protein
MLRLAAPGGRIVLCDGLASDDPSKAQAFNAMERRRDPSTVEFRTLGYLRELFLQAGLNEPEVKCFQVPYLAADLAAASFPDGDDRDGLLAVIEDSVAHDALGMNAFRSPEGVRIAYPVSAFDMGTAMPTFLAGYRRALAGGLDDKEAINEGDRAVRFAHGSSGAADQARIQRGNEYQKCLTMFYSFFNHMYNRERATVKMGVRGVRAARAGDSAGARRDFVAVAGRSLYYLAIPAMVEAMVSPGPNDANENWLEWGGKAILNQMAAGIPILRDLASSALNGYGYEVTPLQQPVEEVGETAQTIARATGLSDKPVSSRWLQHAIDTAGYATGLPLGQAGTAAQYLWDIGDGQADPQSLGDFVHGLMHGAPKGQ